MTSNPIVFPIPLRPGVVVRVQIPSDLTEQEAKKVARFVSALATRAH